jgi:hypothetical protein
MIEALIVLTIYIIVVGLIISLLLWALQQVPLPPPFGQVARVVIVLLGALIVVYLLLGLVSDVGPVHLHLAR